MLCTALISASRSSVRPAILTRRVAAPSLQLIARHQSSKANDEQALKAARKLNDKLQENWKGPVLTYEQLKPKTLSPSNDAYLIDVREPDEVMQGSIPSSVNLPLSVLANSLNLNAQAFRSQHGFDKPGKAQEVVFYCRSGKRSASACDTARRNGYENIINYEGSWLDWVSREGDGKGTSA
ncbi:Rhodanese-like domain-containing protein [Butyriboletus roseoflavus]|nr:Rhodanese-like domain-containing protein [Butyriboletus roseoflavus]